MIKKNSIFSILMMLIVALLFLQCSEKQRVSKIAEHDFVDFGLPSGTLWAVCNVGANNEWESGDYFAWGEIFAKTNYDRTNYKFFEPYRQLTKYCSNSAEGKNAYTDTLTILQPADDAATAIWGRKWQMPNVELWHELAVNCYWVWVENYADTLACGFIVFKAKFDADKGKITKTKSSDYNYSDVHIFLPAAGYHYGENFYDDNLRGYYWTNQLYTQFPLSAYNIVFDTTGILPDCDYGSRDDGLAVRAIRLR